MPVTKAAGCLPRMHDVAMAAGPTVSSFGVWASNRTCFLDVSAICFWACAWQWQWFYRVPALFEARTYTQAGSRYRGFMRWLQCRMFIRPKTIKIPCKASKHDDTRVLADFAFVPPMRLARAHLAENPALLFPTSVAHQNEFFQRLDCISFDCVSLNS